LLAKIKLDYKLFGKPWAIGLEQAYHFVCIRVLRFRYFAGGVPSQLETTASI